MAKHRAGDRRIISISIQVEPAQVSIPIAAPTSTFECRLTSSIDGTVEC